ncbi:hypothetical protein F4778DRAFT_604019 [Xylariomycetidae sp. FL2044]|nr:hypothetical protein F4778DRAFT_604019 [Xylariomycetidae sp. FL2044]
MAQQTVLAACKALNLPEILDNILRHLEQDHPTLVNVIRVNRYWNVFGVRILWNLVPDAKLCAIQCPRRRQMYASNVRHLRVHLPLHNPVLASLLNTQLDRLNTLSLYNQHNQASHEDIPPQLFPPSLEHFYAFGADISCTALRKLTSNCHRLKTFYMLDAHRVPCEVCLMALVSQCQFLTSFVGGPYRLTPYAPCPLPATDEHKYFERNPTVSLHQGLLLRLASHKSLTRVSFCKHISDKSMAMVDEMLHPFTALRTLDIKTITPKALAVLAPLVPCLVNLSFEVEGNNLSNIRLITSLAGLRSLRLTLTAPCTVEAQSLLALASFPKLELLEIKGKLSQGNVNTIRAYGHRRNTPGMFTTSVQAPQFMETSLEKLSYNRCP